MTSTTHTISPAKRALGNLIIILLGICIAVTLAPAVAPAIAFAVLAVMGKIIADVPAAETFSLLFGAAPVAALAAAQPKIIRLYKDGDKCCANFPYLNIIGDCDGITWGYSGHGPAALAAELLFLASQYRDKDGDAPFTWTQEQIQGRAWLLMKLKAELIAHLPQELGDQVFLAVSTQDQPPGAPDLPNIGWQIEQEEPGSRQPGSIYIEISCVAAWAGHHAADRDQDSAWQIIHNKVRDQIEGNQYIPKIHAEQVADAAFQNRHHHLHPFYTIPAEEQKQA